MALSKFSGLYSAFDWAYGVNLDIAPLVVVSGPGVSGVGTVTLNFGQTTTTDGRKIFPSVTTPITIGIGANAETVVPTAVSNPSPGVYGTCQITANFANGHSQGDTVCSGSFGLVEAANAAHAKGGGVVLIDINWTNAGGTNALLHTYKGWANVPVVDARGTSASAAAFSYAATDGGVYTVTAVSWY